MENNSPLPSWLNKTLLPQCASLIFRLITLTRNKLYDHIPTYSEKIDHPVISIGGIRAGGTGKTPAALLTGNILSSQGHNIAFLSRGYGRKNTDQIKIVHPTEHATWDTIGDEPALLHQNLPQSWLGIGAKRLRVADELIRVVPEDTLFILDDGFQHRKIRRDIEIVCVHPHLFSDHMLPWGFLREPLRSLKRADLILLIGSSDDRNDLHTAAEKIQQKFKGLQISILTQKPVFWVNGQTGEKRETLPLSNPSLVCAIARPHRFINTVRSLGIELSDVLCFKDHYVFQLHDLTKKQKLYSTGIVTTEKDYIRLSAMNLSELPQMWYLKMNLEFLNKNSEDAFFSAIKKIKL
ncbi:Tetraacyldisaccharide 4'-kinase [Chitinispirillum alkaliphilum]|nr:Tetraacyldisaccharide 4'-kinase [Chitinispirillum alkaliphilum]